MRRKRSLFEILMLTFCFILCSCGEQKEEILIEQTKETAVQEEPQEETAQKEIQQETRKNENIWVDVCGAVKRPGVYELEADSRVFEAVEAAGGFAEDADTQWLNQAAVLADGQKIQVYTREETEAMKNQGINPEETKPASEDGQKSNGKVNLNTASLEELQEIPGIGQVRAQAILDYREEAGSFQSIGEIQGVPGIKGKTFEKIEDYITVE